MAFAYRDGYCCGLGSVEKHEVIGMADRTTVMSWLEGLAQDDWRMFHSDSEVQEIARSALELITSDYIHEVAKQFRRPIVRCKDCKHSMSYENGFYGCGKGHGLQLGDWFCADGERRD